MFPPPPLYRYWGLVMISQLGSVACTTVMDALFG